MTEPVSRYPALAAALAILLFGACEGESFEGTAAGECADGADNDMNGLFDCDDTNCLEAPECLGDSGDDLAGTLGCTELETADCNGNCAPTEWLGDGECDGGDYPYYGNLTDFNCADLAYDGGDCEPGGDDDDTPGDDDTVGDDDGGDGHDPGNSDVWTFTEIFAVVSDSCGCHAGSTHETGFAFGGSQSGLFSTWLGSDGAGVPSAQNSSMKRIEPGSSANSYVMHKLDGTQATVGGSGGQMPLNGSALSLEERNAIRGWIDDGALDN